ncbi:MAG: ferrochelatase [Acidobacteria bacterium]|nr:ferrochelatase [Acidobacteriota bacterium]MCZ6751879.1 ferrochelatase [Acidobacteriota bacterium]
MPQNPASPNQALPQPAKPFTGVLLLAHGGPDSLDDIEPFLANIRGGKPFPPKLLEEIKRRYRLIGSRSPLLELSRRQAAALEKELNATGERCRVYLGMRNWNPFIRETMGEIAKAGVGRLIAMCLAPQNSRMSVGLYFKRVREAQEELGIKTPTTFVESWHREPLLLDAFAEKLREALAAFPSVETEDGPPLVIFTAHSLPEKILAEGDPYDRETKETAAAVAEQSGLTNWLFAYQSQGATADPWLGPTVESALERLAAEGRKRVLIAPIGFVSDHVEILYDIDIGFRQFAEERGIDLRRIESLNDSPAFIRALASVVQKHWKE